MSDRDALISANEAFYTAFATCDADMMDDLWANRDDITCIHPGWPPLDGLDEVLGSWRCILSAESPLIGISDATAHIHGDVGYVICREHLEPGNLLATNIFARESGVWKLVHHQAGISPSDAPAPINEGTPTIQ